MASASPTLVIDGLLMYVTSCISCDTPQDIQNVVQDTYNDESVTTAKVLLWEHYDEAVDLGHNTARRSKNKHVEDIVDAIRKVDEHYSDKVSLPVIFVASDTRTLPSVRPQPVEPAGDAKFESRVKALEDQMALVLMDARRADRNQTVPLQSRPYSSAVKNNRQMDNTTHTIPGLRHHGPPPLGHITRPPSGPPSGMTGQIDVADAERLSRDNTGANAPRNKDGSERGVYGVAGRSEDWNMVTHARQTVLEDNFWPEDVGCRPFVFKKKTFINNG